MSSRKVENFILKDQSGNDFELYKNLNKAVLLIFYPKDRSNVCTRQLDNYQKNINVFEEASIQVVGINIESVDSHKSFCNMKNIGFPLLSDKDKEVSRRFNALNLFSVNKRKLVLIKTDGEIAYERNIPVFKYDNATKILDDLRTKHII